MILLLLLCQKLRNKHTALRTATSEVRDFADLNRVCRSACHSA